MLGYYLASSIAHAATHAAVEKIGDVVADQVIENNRAQRERQLLQEKMKQEMMQRDTAMRAAMLNELYAKFAICCYIAWADGVITPEEKANLDAVFLDIYNQFSQSPQVKQVLLTIYNTPNLNFVMVERYLRATTPEAIASFLEIADEIAASDGDASDPEKMCIYKLRKYLTDRTGQNFMGHFLYPGANFDVKCPGCAANMVIEHYNNRAVCPYCGNIKYLSADNAGAPAVRENVRASATPITFRCPLCNAYLSAAAGTSKCRCSQCKSVINIRDGKPTVW
ncbi:Tellurite resistance protein TerB [Ruminococcaceae bacterium YRB3002]|nr:Tellurite resistance protein TerB [Ruminococcaceae bacterium YRB3002]